MERPEDFVEREQPPADTNAEIADTTGDAADEDPAGDDRYVGTDLPQAVSDAEDQPDI